MAEPKEAPETTPIADWLIPNQDKFERVIDARLAKLKDEEPKAPRRTAAAKPAAKDADAKS